MKNKLESRYKYSLANAPCFGKPGGPVCFRVKLLFSLADRLSRVSSKFASWPSGHCLGTSIQNVSKESVV